MDRPETSSLEEFLDRADLSEDKKTTALIATVRRLLVEHDERVGAQATEVSLELNEALYKRIAEAVKQLQEIGNSILSTRDSFEVITKALGVRLHTQPDVKAAHRRIADMVNLTGLLRAITADLEYEPPQEADDEQV